MKSVSNRVFVSGVIAVAGLTALLLLGGAVDPLNDSQLQRLAEAADGLPTIDEAAVYALLENAIGWEGDAEAGAVVLDYDGVVSDPDEWRGRLCLVEGLLWRVVEPGLGRSGWDGVRGLVLEIEGDQPDQPDDPDDPDQPDEPQESGRRYVMLYLTNPPQIGLRDEQAGLPWQLGAEVRAVGRFYKVMASETERAGVRSVPVFVGRSVTRIGATGRSAGPRGGGPGGPGVFVVVGVVLVALGYAAYRLHSVIRGIGSGAAEARRRELDRIRAQRERGEVERDEDLPRDPAEALGVLAKRVEHAERSEPGSGLDGGIGGVGGGAKGG